MFDVISNLLYPTVEGLCLPPCKGKKKGKKAKKSAKKTAGGVEDEFGDITDDIQESIAVSEDNGGKSVCNPANFPSNVDIDLLKNIVELSEQASENVQNRNNINDLYKDYYKSVTFNTEYKDKLLEKEGSYYSFAFGEDHYRDIFNTRNLLLTDNNYNDNDVTNIFSELNQQIYINKEIIKNELSLEKTKKELQNEKQEISNEINEIENSVYVINRDTYYDSEFSEFADSLILLTGYVYLILFLFYVYLRLSKNDISLLKESAILIGLAILPNILYDYFILFMEKITTAIYNIYKTI